MPTVKLRFPGGRYHATPWGHHVNEGLIEWPPSPWRLLRALIASGFTHQGWGEAPTVARRLIDKLATVLPVYHLPPASAAHSRHFMPVIEGKSQRTTLVFDTWANVGDGVMFIHWPCELAVEERELLGQWVAALGYLGRSESWVEAQLTDENPHEWNAVPCQPGEHRNWEWEQVSVLAAIPPHDYLFWRAQQVSAAFSPKAKPGRGKKIPENEGPYPPDLWSCLTKDTSWWKGHGWSQPPGSQRVLYWRRRDALEVAVPPEPRSFHAPPVEFMLLALSTPSGQTAALEPITRTLPQAEIFHRTIVANTAQRGRIYCPELTGQDEQGQPLHDRHSHAHTIPLALNDRGRIDHILIYCPAGLTHAAQQGIRRSRETWRKKGPNLQVALVASGSRTDLYQLPREVLRFLLPIIAAPDGATIWESVTPFVPPRFLKPRGKNTLEGQVLAELLSRGLPAAVEIEYDRPLTIHLRHFIRRRTHGGVPPKVDVGFGLRLRFAQPIRGPLLLGYASHYGMGLFRACSSKLSTWHHNDSPSSSSDPVPELQADEWPQLLRV
ncbi:MAG: type I-U CRISPR-associated protein Csb2 [Gemmataceae bacterium]|nr:type I-U CRISPR-associated protein Csb2 [Gemmata sp.]MDW8196196.1 type I-U CRISPR-associated protein Csb2 [Gemmataceae bacterium]